MLKAPFGQARIRVVAHCDASILIRTRGVKDVVYFWWQILCQFFPAKKKRPEKSEPPKKGRKIGAARKLSKSVEIIFDAF